MDDCGTEAAWQTWFVGEGAKYRDAGLFAEYLDGRSLLNSCEGRSHGMGPIQDESDDVDVFSTKCIDSQQGMIDSPQL